MSHGYNFGKPEDVKGKQPFYSRMGKKKKFKPKQLNLKGPQKEKKMSGQKVKREKRKQICTSCKYT